MIEVLGLLRQVPLKTRPMEKEATWEATIGRVRAVCITCAADNATGRHVLEESQWMLLVAKMYPNWLLPFFYRWPYKSALKIKVDVALVAAETEARAIPGTSITAKLALWV